MPSRRESRVSQIVDLTNANKKEVAFALGTKVAQKASVSLPAVDSSSIAVVESEPKEAEDVFKQLDNPSSPQRVYSKTRLRSVEVPEKTKPVADPAEKEIDEDMRSVLNLRLDGVDEQIPKIGKLLNRWKERQEHNFESRPASGSISGRTFQMQQAAQRKSKTSFKATNGPMIILEKEDEEAAK